MLQSTFINIFVRKKCIGGQIFGKTSIYKLTILRATLRLSERALAFS